MSERRDRLKNTFLRTYLPVVCSTSQLLVALVELYAIGHPILQFPEESNYKEFVGPNTSKLTYAVGQLVLHFPFNFF